MSITENFRRYSAKLYLLHRLIASNQGESKEAEEIRDEMDSFWGVLNQEERDSAKYVSEYFAASLAKDNAEEALNSYDSRLASAIPSFISFQEKE